ncbi:hypothetical protein PMAYCL1PPCAC_29982, partial [Pristionchus mayeri]
DIPVNILVLLSTLHSFRYPALLRSREEIIEYEEMPLCAPRSLTFALFFCFFSIFVTLIALMIFYRGPSSPPVVNFTAAYSKPSITPFRFLPWVPLIDRNSSLS